jgi:hypothetical protein
MSMLVPQTRLQVLLRRLGRRRPAPHRREDAKSPQSAVGLQKVHAAPLSVARGVMPRTVHYQGQVLVLVLVHMSIRLVLLVLVLVLVLVVLLLVVVAAAAAVVAVVVVVVVLVLVLVLMPVLMLVLVSCSKGPLCRQRLVVSEQQLRQLPPQPALSAAQAC